MGIIRRAVKSLLKSERSNDIISPFFIIGAPRSGTTMLRDVFKQIDFLYSPEETHIFRWAAPFKSNEYDFIYENNGILRKHRELDGVSDEVFEDIYNNSLTKQEFTQNYCQKVTEIKGKTHWFEKSPQNVYGLPVIASQYPDAKIIHIVRNPYDVIKSLCVGKVIKVDNIVGAANYWAESVAIVNLLKPVLQKTLFEVQYEQLLLKPHKTLSSMSSFLNINFSDFDFKHLKIREPKRQEYFSTVEFEIINKICGKYMDLYNYSRL